MKTVYIDGATKVRVVGSTVRITVVKLIDTEAGITTEEVEELVIPIREYSQFHKALTAGLNKFIADGLFVVDKGDNNDNYQ